MMISNWLVYNFLLLFNRTQIGICYSHVWGTTHAQNGDLELGYLYVLMVMDDNLRMHVLVVIGLDKRYSHFLGEQQYEEGDWDAQLVFVNDDGLDDVGADVDQDVVVDL